MKAIDINKFAYSSDGERYYGEFDTKQEAIDEWMEEHEIGDYGYVGECIKYEFEEDDVDTYADNILEMMDETLGDVCGEFSEDWYSNITKEQTDELNNNLSKVIIEWVNKYKLHSNCYLIENPEKIIKG